MKLPYTAVLVAIFTLLTLAAVACSSAPASEPTQQSNNPIVTPTQTPSSGDTVSEPAPIEEARIVVNTEAYGEGALVVVSGLPNACYSFGEYDVSRNSDTIIVDITNTRPAATDIACAEVYRTVETTIPLGQDIQACKVYDVIINGVTHRIQAIAPNVRCQQPIDYDEVLAPIHTVEINASESNPGEYIAHVVSGLPNGCTSFGRYEMTRNGDTITITVYNNEPAEGASEPVMCTQVYGFVDTDINLGSDFEAGTTYTVEVNDVTETFVAKESGQYQTKEVLAPIDAVEINVGESFPPQYMLHIVSGLPSGCARFSRYEMTRDGDTIKVDVYNTVPDDPEVMCTAIYGMHETTINMGSDFEAGVTYTVMVNDVTKTFVAEEQREEVLAPIESVEINVAESFPPQYMLHIVSGLPSGCASFSRYELVRNGDLITVSVYNTMPSNPLTPCTKIYGYHETNINMGSDFGGGRAYTVLVNDTIKSFIAQDFDGNALDSVLAVRFGESVSIPSEGIEIEFTGLLEDSRCAKDVVCVQAGQGRINVNVSVNGQSLGVIELTKPAAGQDAPARAGDYTIGLVALTPDPGRVGAVEIPQSEYVATLLISKPAAGDLSGGVLAAFRVIDEEFKLWVTNEDTIEQILAIQNGDALGFPNGALLEGAGEANHNAPWSWHIDPEQVEIAELAVEVCDGLPSFIEDDLDYWLNTVGNYCPWSAELVSVQDLR